MSSAEHVYSIADSHARTVQAALIVCTNSAQTNNSNY
jgi:hypothetical protein